MLDRLFRGLDPHKLGTHLFPFRAALRCKKAGLTEDEAERLIDSQEGFMPRSFKPGEVSEAVGNAYGSGDKVSSSPKFPSVNRERQRGIIAGSTCTLEALRQSSPETLDQEPRVNLEKLFPGDPLLCFSREFDRGTISHKLSEINPESLKGASFIVPSPMSSKVGRTQAGKSSPHTKENTGPRRFLIVEIDDKTISKDQQAAIINHLARYAPLVAVVDSAGKSLHAWFYCHGATEEPESPLARFFAYAVALGADPRLWTRCQFTRMPNGTRRITGGVEHEPRRQCLVYFNPTNRSKGPRFPNSNPYPL